ncbi:unnamed protein product [Caenorhabditis brenneri]
MKNLVDQMSKTDLVRVSLQSHKAGMALKECGKNNVSFFKLDREELQQLSAFDRAELFLKEAARQGTLPGWRIELFVEVSEEFSFELHSHPNDFYFLIEVDSLKNIGSYSGVRKNLMIGDHYVPIIITDDKKLISFWNNKATGLVSVLQFFSEDYGLPVSSLKLYKSESPDYSKNLRRIVRACSQLNIRQASVLPGIDADKNISEDDYAFILENIAVNGAFRGHCKTSDKFQFNRKINAKSIRISKAHWFTAEQLFNSKDYTSIWINDSKFTKNEVQTFLRLWKAGEFPELNFFSIDTYMEDPFDALEGFERYHQQRPEDPKGDYYPSIQGFGQNFGRIGVRDRKFILVVCPIQEQPEAEDRSSEDEEEEDEEDFDN